MGYFIRSVSSPLDPAKYPVVTWWPTGIHYPHHSARTWAQHMRGALRLRRPGGVPKHAAVFYCLLRAVV